MLKKRVIIGLIGVLFVLLSYAIIPKMVSASSWLEEWDYRLEIKLNYNDVDEILLDFPVLIHLSNSSGINNQNLTEIFNEIGNNYNNTAYVYNNERLFFDVEYWNCTENLAEIWIEIPEINNITYTILYLYYDVYMDGSEYNDSSKVWDSNFFMIQHMNDNSTSTVLDSTENNNDGTKLDVNEPVEVYGKIGKAQNFDGVDDYITISYDDSLMLQQNFSFFCWVELNEKEGVNWWELNHMVYRASGGKWKFLVSSSRELAFGRFKDAAWQGIGSGLYIDWDSLHFVGFSWTDNTFTFRLDNQTQEQTLVSPVDVGAGDSWVGRSDPSFEMLKGSIDEIQVSGDLSNAWANVLYENQRDNFMIYGEITSLLIGDVMLIAVLALMIALFSSFLVITQKRGK